MPASVRDFFFNKLARSCQPICRKTHRDACKSPSSVLYLRKGKPDSGQGAESTAHRSLKYCHIGADWETHQTIVKYRDTFESPMAGLNSLGNLLSSDGGLQRRREAQILSFGVSSYPPVWLSYSAGRQPLPPSLVIDFVRYGRRNRVTECIKTTVPEAKHNATPQRHHAHDGSDNATMLLNTA